MKELEEFARLLKDLIHKEQVWSLENKSMVGKDEWNGYNNGLIQASYFIDGLLEDFKP